MREQFAKTLRFRTTQEMVERVKRVAKKRFCDSSDIMRQAITEYLRAESSRTSAGSAK